MATTVTNQIRGITISESVKAPVLAVSTVALTLSGLQTVGGVVLAAGDRVLVKDQADATENGIYDASTSAWQRSPDFDGNDDIVEGTLILTADADASYRVTSADPIVIGTDDIDIEEVGFVLTQPEFEALLALSPPYEPSDAEIATGVDLEDLIVEPLRPRHSIERYGVSAANANNDSYLTNAALVSAQGVQIFSDEPNQTYELTSEVTVGNYFDLDLRSSKLKPVGNTRCLQHNFGGMGATTSKTVSSGATKGSRDVVVANTTSLAVGQYVIFVSNSASYASGSWPNNWAKIKEIVGTTVSIDKPLGCSYPATVTMHAYNAANFGELFRIKGLIDMSESTYVGSGPALWLSGYALIDCEKLAITGAALSDTSTTLVQTLTCLDIEVSGRAMDNFIGGNVFDLQSCRTVNIHDVTIEGGGFGINVYRATDVNIRSVALNGTRQFEVDESNTDSRSIRGLKLFGCLNTNISNAALNGYASPIKHEDSFNMNLTNFSIKGGSPEASDVAVNIGGNGTIDHAGLVNISNFTIEDLTGGGAAIGVSDAFAGQCTIANGIIRNVAGHGIFTEYDAFLTVSGVTIEDWDTGATGFRGIFSLGGGSFSDITFRNSDNTRQCFQTLESGKEYSFSNINNPDGCVLFAGGLHYKTGGTATILSGNQFITVTHLALRTPLLHEITLTMGENPTNTPGHLWPSDINSTTFRINYTADPGASNLDVGWNVELTMPFTAP